MTQIRYPNFPNDLTLQTNHIVWGTYGARLPGTLAGWRRHGKVSIQPSLDLTMYVLEKMLKTEVTLDSNMRRIAADAILEAAREYKWMVHAINVRTNHVHVLITSDADTSYVDVISALKYAATKSLHGQGYFVEHDTVWSKKGYARLIGTAGYFRRVYDYVCEQ